MTALLLLPLEEATILPNNSNQLQGGNALQQDWGWELSPSCFYLYFPL